MAWQAAATTREAANRTWRALDRSVERLRMLLQAAEMTADSVERVARGPAVTAATLQPALARALAAIEQRPEPSCLGIALPEHGQYGNLERTADGLFLLCLYPGAAPGQQIGVLDVDFDLPAMNRFLAAVADEYGMQLQILELGPTPRLLGDRRSQGAPLPPPDAPTSPNASGPSDGCSTWPSTMR